MTIFAGCAMMVGAASFAATIGVLEVPVVDRVTGRTVGTESSMVSRCVMAGGTGRGKSHKYTGRMATGAG
jgi:hypothetical protein